MNESKTNDQIKLFLDLLVQVMIQLEGVKDDEDV